jgi:hypothetical protein
MALALLIAASLTAQPARLVLGRDPGADLETRAAPGAKVTFTTNLGTITNVQRLGETVRARFNPPPLRAPTVALVLAQVDEGGERELRWLAIPLSGSDTMVIETRPGSKVEATAGDLVLGHASAGDDGTARLPMVVPPGVRNATIKITDRLGNSNEKPFDLSPPPFSRVRLAARSEAASTTSTLEVEVFVVKGDGTPDDEATVAVSADEGETSLRNRTAPGVYLAEFVPEGKPGTARLEAKASGQAASLEVPVRGAPVERQPFWRAKSGTPWGVSAGVLGGLGSSYGGSTAGSMLAEIAVRVRSYPVELLLDLGGSTFAQSTQYAAVPALAEGAKASAFMAQVGVRGGVEVLRRLGVHASFALGLQDQHVKTTFPLNLGQFEDSGVTARFALGLGVNYRLGPGRALAQLQFDWAAARVAQLAGSTSGLQAMLGYLVSIR